MKKSRYSSIEVERATSKIFDRNTIQECNVSLL